MCAAILLMVASIFHNVQIDVVEQVCSDELCCCTPAEFLGLMQRAIDQACSGDDNDNERGRWWAVVGRSHDGSRLMLAEASRWVHGTAIAAELAVAKEPDATMACIHERQSPPECRSTCDHSAWSRPWFFRGPLETAPCEPQAAFAPLPIRASCHRADVATPFTQAIRLCTRCQLLPTPPRSPPPRELPAPPHRDRRDPTPAPGASRGAVAPVGAARSHTHARSPSHQAAVPRACRGDNASRRGPGGEATRTWAPGPGAGPVGGGRHRAAACWCALLPLR